MPDDRGYLPALPDDAAVEPEYIFEGEVVDEPEPAPKVVVLRPVVQVITVVVRHPVPRATARHAGYVAAGVLVAVRRRQLARARAERMMRAAETAGDHATVLLWRQHLEEAKQKRHERIVKTAETVVTVAKWSPVILAVPLLCAFALGCLLAAKWGVHGFLWPWEFLISCAVVLADALSLLPLIVVAGAGAALLVLHELGRRGGDLAPGWLGVSADSDVDVAIDERAVTQALAQLRIPQITDHLKTGPLAYITACRQEGRGTYCEVRLPGGLPAMEIARQQRRERLAASLYRQTKEVWPSTGEDNSVLKLWVADKGALADGAGPYPLLAGGATDVFKGVPFGKTLRGDEVTAPLMERNTITGGMPGQGKSSAARVIMCGAALDPTAELWIMIPDVNFDFEVMKRRCSRYVMGAEDEHVETIRDWLQDLKDEVQARGQLLVDYEVPAVTRKLASAGVGLHPVFALLEEAHVAIQHSTYGKEIAGLLTDVVKLGRKRGIHVIVSTQAPTKDSMPRDVTRNCSNGIAFAVGDHVPNDALLGAGAYRAGHRATELIPGTDRGVAVVKGFSGERSEMVQVYFLDVERGHDQVTPIIDRAMAEVARRGGLPGGPPPVLAIEARDLLDDLDEVLAHRSGKVRVAELPDLLHNLAPSWGEYRALNGVQLRKLLLAKGVTTTNPGNVPTLDTGHLRDVIARRDREVS